MAILQLSEEHARLLHMRLQGLEQRPDTIVSAAQVVGDVCGLQAQDLTASILAVRARSNRLTFVDVENALWQERSVVRTWCLRGTLHLIAAADLSWLLPLLGPGLIAASRRRYIELGMDKDLCDSATRSILDALSSRGPLTRLEIAQHLSAQDIVAEGQVLPHLLRRAALGGQLCLGPNQGNNPTYVLLEDWVRQERSLSQDDAMAALAHRYLSAYGPAGPDDLAAWAGLNASKARRAWSLIADELVQVDIGGCPVWMLKSQTAGLEEPPTRSPNVRLLPAYDTYLLGYANRNLIVAPQYAKRINSGGGVIHPTLLVDGFVHGTWSAKQRKDRLEILVEPFISLSPDIRDRLQAETEDLSRFMGVKVYLSMATPMPDIL